MFEYDLVNHWEYTKNEYRDGKMRHQCKVDAQDKTT